MRGKGSSTFTRGFAFTILLILLFCSSNAAVASFVYETPTEFISNGDFNGDGRLDALVLDKSTGNARVGFQDANGALTWAAPMPSGVEQAGALAVGRFAQTNRDAIAVTSVAWNRLNILDLSNPTNAPFVVRPAHVGPSLLVGLEAPYGIVTPFGWLGAGAEAEHDPGVTLLDLFGFLAEDLAYFQDQIAAEGRLSSGNSLKLGADATTYLAGLRAGATTRSRPIRMRTRPMCSIALICPRAPRYAFGRFRWGQDTQTTPGLLFYVPGQSNVMAQRVIESASGFTLSVPTTTTFTSAVQRVYCLDEGTNGVGIVQFGDGAVGVRPASGSDQLQETYRFGVGTAGNVVTGFVPLGLGKFALLSGGSNTFSSAQSQVFTQSGSNYVQTTTSALSPPTANGTRANVWLFAHEPFVSANPAFVASLNAGAWITSLSGLPGVVSVMAESDRGVTNGLGNPTARNLASPSLNAAFGIANQYHPTISLFSYSSPRAAEPVLITITPPPGHYEDSIAVSFTTADVTDHVFYRVGGSGFYQDTRRPSRSRRMPRCSSTAPRRATRNARRCNSPVTPSPRSPRCSPRMPITPPPIRRSRP